MFGLPSRSAKYTTIAGDDFKDEETIHHERHRSWSRRKYCIFIFCATLVVVAAPLVFLWRQQSFKPQTTLQCSNPKARREWRLLSGGEKQEYIAAVQCLHRIPSRQRDEGKLSDDFPYVHIRVSGGTHYTDSFLLWHRYFIWIYESLLQNECNYTGVLPYWDWTLDWQDPTKSPIWASNDGFGGDGEDTTSFVDNANNGSCISSGPFMNYEVHYANQKTSPHCLTRGFGRETSPPHFSGNAFAPDIIDALYSHESLAEFSMGLEETSHDAIPNGIGGDFSLFTAPSDPVWFLHHAQIDRLFWRWQNENPARRKSVEGLVETTEAVRHGLETPMMMHDLAPDIPAGEILDIESGMLCYKYA